MNLRKTILYSLLAVIFLSVLSYPHLLTSNTFLSALQLKTYDFFLQNRYNHSPRPKQTDSIILIDADDKTMHQLKQRWPINRGYYAIVLQKLLEQDAQPAVIAFDFAFSGKSEQPEADLFLSDMLKKSRNTVLATYIDNQGLLAKPEKIFIDSAACLGLVNSPVDSDLIQRRIFPYIKLSDQSVIYNLGLQAFSLYHGISLSNSEPGQYNTSLILPPFPGSQKGINVPINPQTNSSIINFLAKKEDFYTVPLWKVLSGLIPGQVFKDKIVLLGSSMVINHDIYQTPLGAMPGVLINANFLLSLLAHRPLTETPLGITLGILLILGLFMGLVSFNTNNVRALSVLVMILLMGFFSCIIAFSHDTILDFSGVTLITILSFILANIAKYILISIETNQLRNLAMTDGLTGLYAFRYFQVKLNMEIQECKKTRSELSLIMFDIDNFKKFNDTHGHEGGNEALRVFAAILSSNSRKTDTVARFGGEEFAIILPQTSLSNASRIAEKIRIAVEDCSIHWQDGELKITTSIGVASYPHNSNLSGAQFIDRADKALYAAKHSGKNKVCAFDKTKT